MRYLDPKADLTFKKVFGEHKDIIISFLNAMLPFESEDDEIKSVEYLPSELFPHTPLSKNSIVDVRCRDNCGRQFIVEMQMMWTSAYKQRVLFNASKAYVRQLDKGEHYDELQPVYSLNILNDVYSESENYYHDYSIVEVENTKEVLEGLRFIFIELPKFSPKTISEKKMQVLWLRYLTEITEKTHEVSSELMENPLVSKAVNSLEVSAFTEAQLQGYDDFWDAVSTAKTNISSGYKDGMKKGLEDGMKKGLEDGMKKGLEDGMKKGLEDGMKKGREEGMKKGRAEGRAEASLDIARSLKQSGVPNNVIAQSTGLTEDEIKRL